MLYLDRTRGQSIFIGEGENTIKVRVLSIHDGVVRIGFECDKKIAIVREEIMNRSKTQSVKPI